jgi:hypothetical protein
MITALINRRAVRTLALDISKNHRAGKFTRVAPEFFAEIETIVRRIVTDRVMRQGGGKTLT